MGEEAANKRREILGEEHPDTIRSLQNLVEICSKLDEDKVAGDEKPLCKVHSPEIWGHNVSQGNVALETE